MKTTCGVYVLGTSVLTCSTDDILSEKLGHDDHLGLEHPNRNRSQWVKYESLNIR